LKKNIFVLKYTKPTLNSELSGDHDAHKETFALRGELPKGRMLERQKMNECATFKVE